MSSFFNIKNPPFEVRKEDSMGVLLMSTLILPLLYLILKPTAKWLGKQLLKKVKSCFKN